MAAEADNHPVNRAAIVRIHERILPPTKSGFRNRIEEVSELVGLVVFIDRLGVELKHLRNGLQIKDVLSAAIETVNLIGIVGGPC